MTDNLKYYLQIEAWMMRLDEIIEVAECPPSVVEMAEQMRDALDGIWSRLTDEELKILDGRGQMK